jgi:REP element-mobilizing transposase RayT
LKFKEIKSDNKEPLARKYCSLGFLSKEKEKNMANTYHQIYLQTVFAVKYRNAVIEKEWKHELFSVIGNLINEADCKNIIVNGVEDHVHCFFSLKPVVSVSELMKTVKAKSSKYLNDKSLTKERFEWQVGYGVFSYSQSQIGKVYDYILNQEQHHKKQTFKNEYLQLLESFKIDYDENYLFEDLI